jgi:uncharacterized protein YggU (UPF0235/DUF167 family)
VKWLILKIPRSLDFGSKATRITLWRLIVQLDVLAHPHASRDRFQVLDGGTVAVWVRARPVGGAANAAIERLLARALGLRPRDVAVSGGQTSRRKTVSLELDSDIDLWERLRAAERAG